MIHPFKFLAPASALACVSCVQADGEPAEPAPVLSSERACFSSSQINGYSKAPDGPDGDRLYVRTGASERFLLETWGPCPDLDWTFRIAIDSRFTGNLCTGDTATVFVPSTASGVTTRCTARVLGKVAD